MSRHVPSGLRMLLFMSVMTTLETASLSARFIVRSSAKAWYVTYRRGRG